MSDTTAIRMSAESSKGKIVINSLFDEERAGFLGSLPGAKWNRELLRWTCDRTPAACWRLVSRDDADCGPDIEDEAARFADRMAPFRPDELTQPPVRRFDAWRHQIQAYHFAARGDATLLAMAMGTGKSKVAIDLIQNRGFQRTLILCPMSVVRVWPDQFEQHGVENFHVETLDGPVAKKLKLAQEAVKHAHYRDLPLVLVCNYESAWRGALGQWLLSREWDAVILDESHRIKSHDSAVSKFCGKLGKQAGFRLCLTGTPMAVPSDVFGQYRFLDPGLFGTSYHRFRACYARMNPYIPGKVEEWINQEKLAELFGTIAYQVDASVLDLPESMHERRWVDLSPAACEAYESLEEELIAEIDGGTVTAANGLVKLLRLQQLTSGYIVDEDSQDVVRVDHSKAEALRELLEDIGREPTVVFCRFREDLHAVRSVCETLGRRCGELSGSDKSGLTDAGRMAEDVDVLACQIQSGGVGIDLTRARYAIYFSVGFDLLNFKQSLARVHRPGQDRPVIYYHILARNTVDPVIYGALDKKQDVVEAVLGHLKGRE